MPSRNAILDMLYRGTTTIQEFNWDSMNTIPILYLMTPDDIEYIHKLIISPRYSGNNRLKMQKIDEVMHLRGFTRFAGGTNRLVYIHPSAPNAVFKVAIDSIGINDNPAEFKNQQFLKPYCCKVFECSPCGTIASFERVERITTFEEFYTIADDVFYLLSRVILGKYVMEDIGIDYFMNYGIRKGFSPVILDFPYLFELDGAKLECSSQLDDGSICRGEIDYDHGFNKLVCKKCGRNYRARDLAKPPENGGILLRSKGGRHMRLELKRGDEVIKVYDTTVERDYLSKHDNDATNKNGLVKIDLVGSRAPKEQKVETTNAVPIHAKVEKSTVVETTDNVNSTTKKEIRYINVEIGGTAKPKEIDTNISRSVKVVITGSRENTPIIKKEQVVTSTNTNKMHNVTPKVEAADPKTPVSERVIEVSIGNTAPKVEIVKEVSENPIKVELSTLGHAHENNVKIDTKPVEEIHTEEVVSKHDIFTHAVSKNVDPVEKEQENEIIDNPEIIPIDEEDIEKNKTLIPALIFDESDSDDDVQSAIENIGDGGYADDEPEEEQSESTMEEETMEEFANEKEVKTVEETPIDEVESTESSEQYVEEKIDATTEENTHEENFEVINENYDTEDEYNISIRNELPPIEEALPDIFYCIPKDKDIDISAYDDVTDPTLIDPTLFDIYLLYNKSLIKALYNHDTEEWEVAPDDFTPGEVTPEFKIEETDDGSDDELIEAMKASSKKASLDDL